MNKAIKEYFQEVQKHLSSGNATEHTYRPALQRLLESLLPGATATNEPKRVECGAPDFIVTFKGVPQGHVEAKDIGINLVKAENTDQLKRYLESLSNLILTNYLQFRLYQNSELIMEANLGRQAKSGKLNLEKDGPGSLEALMEVFGSASMPTIASPKELANRMAAMARLLRDTMKRALALEDTDTGPLHQQLKAFRVVLLSDLAEDQFSDMYAQTICYGLFAARCRHKSADGVFSRKAAVWEIPQTNPFLREVFEFIAGSRLDDSLVWAVDHLAYLLDKADMSAILKDFGKRTMQQDPVVHFYETFLAAYDPELREKRGVYYTPEPVVSYIVRSVDHILKKDFSLGNGLANTDLIDLDGGEIHRVLILDPAAGTGTFLHGVVDQIHHTVTVDKKMAGAWDAYVSKHLLPRLFGFELLMAPYAVCHLKMAIQLDELGYKFNSGERLRVYLTNTLQEAFEASPDAVFAGAIAKEANAAGEIKTKAPVMVVLGNPPYSGHSANENDWIAGLLRGQDEKGHKETANYFKVDGKPLGEKNPKWLNNDYVKFIRFSQWRIERTGYGVLAFICDNGYLDNPTFRGMRESLIKTFDDIYILDLHGNSRKLDMAPDGSKDENVFDIQQGVAIGIFVKRSLGSKDTPANVQHSELWGIREETVSTKGGNQKLVGGKYQALNESDLTNSNWTTLSPKSPYYLLIPYDSSHWTEYEKGWSINDIVAVKVLGFQSHRDNFAVDFDFEVIENRIAEMKALRLSDGEFSKLYALNDNRDWCLSKARRDLRKDANWKSSIIKCGYRPFDTRWCYFSKVVMDYPRTEMLDHVAHRDNLCINTVRQTKSRSWQHAIASNVPTPAVFVEVKDGSTVFPLYRYPQPSTKNGEVEEKSIPAKEILTGTGRVPNLSRKFVLDFSNRLKLTWKTNGQGDLKKTFGPEDVFHYIYAVLHSPTYRARYGEYLKMDFPRIPLTSNICLMRSLCELGKKLKDLHLMECDIKTFATFPERGNNAIEKIKYNPSKQRVHINKVQYFGEVTQQVWDFYIGGYQVANKWLKDRKGRNLSFDEIVHYQKIITVLDQTMLLMDKIDEVILTMGGWPIK